MGNEKSVGGKLASLNALRENIQSLGALDLLRKSLADRSNHVIGRAADIVGESEEKSFIEDLRKAYQRLMNDPLKSDPGCVARRPLSGHF